MMPPLLLVLVVVVVLVERTAVVRAFPAGAGACPAGTAAVGNPHTGGGRSETTGTLADGGIVVTLDGVPLGDKELSFRVGDAVEIEMTTAEDSTPLKGFLIRVGPPAGTANAVDLRDSIMPVSSNDTSAQIAATTCVEVENVGGLTHTSNDLKTVVKGSLLVEEALPQVSMDVTVVIENVASSSIYYYSNFILNVVVPNDPESPVAASSAASAPGAAPTVAPLDGSMTSGNASSSGGSGIGVEEENEGQQLQDGGGGAQDSSTGGTDSSTSTSSTSAAAPSFSSIIIVSKSVLSGMTGLAFVMGGLVQTFL